MLIVLIFWLAHVCGLALYTEFIIILIFICSTAIFSDTFLVAHLWFWLILSVFRDAIPIILLAFVTYKILIHQLQRGNPIKELQS